MTTNKTIVFSLKKCPNCEILKQLLTKEKIPFDEIDMKSPTGATELFSNNVFTMQAPVLKFNNKYWTNITTVGNLDIKIVTDIIKSEKEKNNDT